MSQNSNNLKEILSLYYLLDNQTNTESVNDYEI